MKRFLLFAAAAAAVSVSMASTTVTVRMADVIAATPNSGGTGFLDPSRTYQKLAELEYHGFKFNTVRAADNETANLPVWNKAGDYRVYAGTEMTLSNTSGVNMTRIVFTVSADGLRRFPAVTSSTGSVESTVAAREVVWTGDAASVTFSLSELAQNGTESDKPGILQFDKVMITLDADVEYSSSPEITPKGGRYPDKVEVSIKAAEGAKIYYTTDGTAPTEESALYSAPFTLTQNATVKAMAIEEGKEPSNVVDAQYVIMHGTDITDLVQFLTLNSDWNASDPNMIYTFKGQYTVAYQNGPLLYLQDATAGLLVAGRTDMKYQPGDVVTGFSGTFQGINGLPELAVDASSLRAAESHSDYVWAEATAEDLQNRMNVNRAYELKNIEYSPDTEAENVNAFGFAKYGDFTIGVYNGFGSASQFDPVVKLPTKGNYDMRGVLTVYKNDETEELRIMPVWFGEAVGVEAVEAEVVARTYTDLYGRRLSEPCEGVSIMTEHKADGTVRSVKVIR